MKKLTTATLDTMLAELQILSPAEQRKYVGGVGSCKHSVSFDEMCYQCRGDRAATWDTFLTLSEADQWPGGWYINASGTACYAPPSSSSGTNNDTITGFCKEHEGFEGDKCPWIHTGSGDEFCSEHKRWYGGLDCPSCLFTPETVTGYCEDHRISWSEVNGVTGYCPECENSSGSGGNTGGGSGGNSGGSGGSSGQKSILQNIDLTDRSKFVGYDLTGNCMAGCRGIMANYEVDTDSSVNVYQLLFERDGVLEYYDSQNYVTTYENAIACINRHLDADRPIIVGVNHTLNKVINEGVTDHWIVVTGRGFDTERNMYYYTYMETGRSGASVNAACDTTTNRLYYDEENHTFKDECAGSKNQHEYNVTQVRPNDGQNLNETIVQPQKPKP